MAGIVINKSSTWSVAGWVHDFTVGLLLKYLPPDACPELKNILHKDQVTGLGFFSIEDLDSASLGVLKRTLEQMTRALRSGEEYFATPSFLPSYLDRLRELQSAVANDDRLK
ncbi:MAG TPA: hypothetical protein VF988_08015 [Verrucomicrobiae bacterium]